jgi:hypothetical protein
MFCVNERLLAPWNQHGRFQLLCQPTVVVVVVVVGFQKSWHSVSEKLTQNSKLAT